MLARGEFLGGRSLEGAVGVEIPGARERERVGNRLVVHEQAHARVVHAASVTELEGEFSARLHVHGVFQPFALLRVAHGKSVAVFHDVHAVFAVFAALVLGIHVVVGLAGTAHVVVFEVDEVGRALDLRAHHRHVAFCLGVVEFRLAERPLRNRRLAVLEFPVVRLEIAREHEEHVVLADRTGQRHCHQAVGAKFRLADDFAIHLVQAHGDARRLLDAQHRRREAFRARVAEFHAANLGVFSFGKIGDDRIAGGTALTDPHVFAPRHGFRFHALVRVEIFQLGHAIVRPKVNLLNSAVGVVLHFGKADRTTFLVLEFLAHLLGLVTPKFVI